MKGTHSFSCLRPRRRVAAVLLWLILLLALAQPVHGQRAVMSLGKRLQKRFGAGSRRQKDEEDYILEGEKQKTLLSGRFLVVYAATCLLLGVGYFLLLYTSAVGRRRNDQTSMANGEEEEDLVIEDDHLAALAHLEQVDVAFEGLRLSLDTKKSKNNGNGQRVLLDGSVRGRAKPGRMLAIMGPSGAGKSTVLHALAGRIKDSSKLKLEGMRYVNGAPVSGDSMLPVAFIEQDVDFFPYMTVRETLDFRTELKLGRTISKAGRETIVDELLDELGLKAVADTIVGSNKVRGISGGERKRLSIAVEMISSPQAIFLDEPTSGLDSTAATNLMETLRELADMGKTVIAVIHQPSQHVFAKFDDLLLVSEGKMMYFGERQRVRSYMEDQGYRAEPELGTAEHVLDCISRNPMMGESEEDADARMEHLAFATRTLSIDLGVPSKTEDKDLLPVRHFASLRGQGPKAGLLRQFKLLLNRSFHEILRGRTTLFVKMAQQVTLGLIYGGIYHLGTNQASIQDRFGLLSLIAIGSANQAIATTCRAFPREKSIVSNEIASNMYRTLPYFVGKALSELPLSAFFSCVFGGIVYKLTGLSMALGKFRRFMGLLVLHNFSCEAAGLAIGAFSPNSDVSLALFPAIIVLNIIFDGKNISQENTPKVLRWIPKVGLIRWGFEGLSLNEFEGLQFDTGGPRRGPVARTGMDALDRFGLGAQSLGDVVRAQTNIAVVCWLLSYLGLTLTRQRFLIMRSPKDEN